MLSRKRSISSLLNDPPKPPWQKKSSSRRKVICNCTKCNGSLVDYRTKNAHESRVQQSPKRQSSDLSFSKLALSSQEQMEGPGSSQDLIDEVEEVPDTSAPVENEFSLRSRTRNPALNRIMSFNEDYESSAIEEFEAESALKAFDKTLKGLAIVEFESDLALEAFRIHSATAAFRPNTDWSAGTLAITVSSAWRMVWMSSELYCIDCSPHADMGSHT